MDPVVGPDDSNEAATNFNPFNTDIKTVRGQESGYATWNPLANYGLTLANGNLDWQGGTNSRYCRPTLFADSGKWYCEFHMRSTSHIPGIIREDHKDAGGILGELASSRFQNNGTIGYSGGDTVSGGTTWAAGDCVQLFMDMDNKSIYWGVNGIMKIGDDGLAGNPLSGSTHTGAVIYPGVDGLTDRISEKAWGPAAGTPSANSTSVYSSVNFGQKPFKYAPPDGFQPWNAANVRPETVISRPDHYVGIVTYTGDSSTSRLIAGLNFNDKPDLIWIKNRDESIDHTLYDSIRGFGANKEITPNDTYSEGQTGTGNPNTDVWGYVNSNNFNGFTVNKGSNSTPSVVNSNNIKYVAWAWKAGGNKNTFNVDDVGYASAAAVNMSVGALNSASYNQSEVWSNGFSPSASDSGTGTRAFNGEIGIQGGYFSGGVTWTPSSPIIYYDKVEVIDAVDQKYGVNGSTQTAIVLNKWTTIAQTSGGRGATLNSIGITRISDASTTHTMQGLRIDGKLLVDSGVTPSSVPSIAPSGVSVGTKQGFSIVKFNSGSSGNKTLPHGLSKTPTFILVKTTGSTSDWSVYHKDLGGTLNNYLVLNTTAANATATNIWGTSGSTSSIFGIKSGTTCATSQNVIAYLWHDVPGLQKFGKYTGNNNADGPFIELGFRPAIVWVKRFDSSTGDWRIWDTTRDPFNFADNKLYPNKTDEETGSSDTNEIDILSNGFKLRSDVSEGNADGGSYIYCAWAEAPVSNLYGAQSNAR